MSIIGQELLNICTKFKRMLAAQPCYLCGATSTHGTWCDACDASLPYLNGPHCPVCALPTAGGEQCGRCLREMPCFDRTVAVFSYSFPVNKLIQALKHGGQLALAGTLANRLAQSIHERPDCIIPMPLHPARLRQRSFNQSQELARLLSRQLNIPLLHNVCQRVRDTPPQARLSGKERNRNVHHAFSCTQNLSGLRIAMVDDVMTSGASLNEMARALRRAGAREISAWVLARTLPHTGTATPQHEISI